MAEVAEKTDAEGGEEWVPDAEAEALASEELENLVEIVEDDDDDKGSSQVAKDEEPEPDPNKGSDRFQKRIDKLTAKRREAERRANESDARADNLEKRLGALEESTGRQSAEGFQRRYNAVKNELLEATEAGDTPRQVELQEQLADMRATVRIAEAQKRNQPTPSESEPVPEEEDAPPLAYDWWKKNQWFNSTEHRAETAYAREIDAQLDAEGYDKFEPEYYEELDSRLQSQFPKLYNKEGSKVKDEGSEAEESKPKPKPPTAPTGGQAKGGGQPKDGRIRLTRDQLKIAQELGLSTESELREYVKEIQKQEAE